MKKRTPAEIAAFVIAFVVAAVLVIIWFGPF